MNVCDFGLAASWRNRVERMDDSSVFQSHNLTPCSTLGAHDNTGAVEMHQSIL